MGNKLIYEKRGNIELRFGYNSFGNLSLIEYTNAEGNTSYYYVVCNSRGDVEALYNSKGELRARYVYDSWGNTLSITNASGEEVPSNGIGRRINGHASKKWSIDSHTNHWKFGGEQ